MIAISFTLGLSQRPAARGPGIYGRSSSRDAQLPAALYADGFGGAMMAVTGCTKNSSHKRHTQGQPSVFGIDNVDITLSGTSTPTTASCWNRRSTRPRKSEGLLTRK